MQVIWHVWRLSVARTVPSLRGASLASSVLRAGETLTTMVPHHRITSMSLARISLPFSIKSFAVMKQPT